MAKDKNQDDSEISRVDGQQGPVSAGPSAEERLAALEAENKKLKAELAASKKPQAANTAPVDQAKLPRFVVKLKDGPSWVVAATDEANAVQAYFQATNILNAPNHPTAERVSNDVPLGRYTEPQEKAQA